MPGGSVSNNFIQELYSLSMQDPVSWNKGFSIGFNQILFAKIYQEEFKEAKTILNLHVREYPINKRFMTESSLDQFLMAFTGMYGGGPMAPLPDSAFLPGFKAKPVDGIKRYIVTPGNENVAASDSEGNIIISKGLIKAVTSEILRDLTGLTPKQYLVQSIAIYNGDIDMSPIQNLGVLSAKDVKVSVDPKTGQPVMRLFEASKSRGGVMSKAATDMKLGVQVKSVLEFIGLHELAHIRLGHNVNARNCEQYIKNEYEADQWAVSYLINNNLLKILGNIDFFSELTGYNAFFQSHTKVKFGENDFSGKCKYPDPRERMARLQSFQRQQVSRGVFPKNSPVVPNF